MVPPGQSVPIAIVGVGKIARDQHLPAIAASGRFALAATADPRGGVDGVPAYDDVGPLLAEQPDIAAVALCQPPQFRHAAAMAAIGAGKHVLLEKPPGKTVAEVEALAAAARAAGVTLFAAWHSRFAAGVEAAREWLAGKAVRSIRIDWREDVRHWHPGQQWIWEPGGLGVFDPGINALSILTRLIPDAIRVEEAVLDVPGNRAMPIAAELSLRTAAGVPVAAVFDFRQTGPQTWAIVAETDAGTLTLADGGQRLAIDGVDRPVADAGEYPALYARFASLIETGRSDVDVAPLRLVADAFLIGRRQTVEAFHD